MHSRFSKSSSEIDYSSVRSSVSRSFSFVLKFIFMEMGYEGVSSLLLNMIRNESK